MRSTWVSLLLVGLLLVAVQPLLAADPPKLTPDQIRAKIAEIDAKCDAVAKTVEELQALKAELLQQLGQKAPAPTPVPAKKAGSWADRITVSGYTQARVQAFSADLAPPASDFSIRRYYLNLHAQTSARSDFLMTWGSTGKSATENKAIWTNLYAQYMVGKHDTVRFGQAPPWFGLEEAQSSEDRLPLERSAFLGGGPAGTPAGLFFAGRYDRGLWWIHTPADNRRWPQLIASVTNGSPGHDPLNNGRAVGVDLKWRPRWGQFGLSWLNSEFSQPAGSSAWSSTVAPGPFARDAWLGYFRYEKAKRFAVQSEYVGGVFNTHSIRGWYGQGELPLRHVPGTVFAKYEWYNPTSDESGSPNVYQAWILGYAHQLNRNNRITAQQTWGRLDSPTQSDPLDLSETGLQWQYSF